MYNLTEVMKEFSEVPTEEDMKYRVIAYSYELDGYEGDAYVLLEHDNKYYEVHGSHCSCYGLEGMWELEETTPEAIKHRIDEGRGYYGSFGVCVAEIKEHFKDQWEVDTDN